MKKKESTLKKVFKMGRMLGLAAAMTLGAVGCSQTQTEGHKKSSAGRRSTVSYQQSASSKRAVRSDKKVAGQGWSVSDENVTVRRSSYYQSQKDEGVIRMGVLMPNPGENDQEYEARRMRMENLHRISNARKVKLYHRQWTQLKSEGADQRLVDAAAKAYADAMAAPKEIISYYSVRGQEILLNGNAPNRSSTQAGPASRRAQRSIDDF